MEITASMVKELREASGAGMMDCKKALNECGGNMEEAMEVWLEIYADEPFWSKSCHDKTLNLGAAIASEFARLITIEFESKITGSERAEYLQEQYERLLEQLRVRLEAGCAVGGIMFKPYVRNGVILP